MAENTHTSPRAVFFFFSEMSACYKGVKLILLQVKQVWKLNKIVYRDFKSDSTVELRPALQLNINLQAFMNTMMSPHEPIVIKIQFSHHSRLKMNNQFSNCAHFALNWPKTEANQTTSLWALFVQGLDWLRQLHAFIFPHCLIIWFMFKTPIP